MSNLLKYHFILTCSLVLLASESNATHNRAGEITVVQIDEYTIRATINTYTKESSQAADRDSISIDWGDGTMSKVKRINGSGNTIGNNVKKNIYVAEHIYPGRGTFTIGFLDPNRIENILNIDYPNSVNIPFYIETTISLLNTNFQGRNNTVQLLQAPIDFACIKQRFVHNPGAYDIDGDSISYEFISPLLDKGTPVPNYILPSLVNPGINNQITLNPTTGTIVWESPQKEGEYNICFVIKEFRNGRLISSTIRDMQILVLPDCKNNLAPIIESIQDTCVVAGSIIQIPIKVFDPNSSGPGSKYKVEFNGSAFNVLPQASHSFPSIYFSTEQQGILSWQTTCDLISPNPYEVTIKATDDFLDSIGLSTLKVIRIKVVGPAPNDFQVFRKDSGNLLLWKNPYTCQSTNLFKGFSIWKRVQPTPFVIDTCNTTLPASIYKKIYYLTLAKQDSQYYFLDKEILQSNCYRVQAEFAKTTNSGFPYNFVGSIASDEQCIDDKNDRLLLKNIDVVSTDLQYGKIKLKWAKPNLTTFDLALNPPPYTLTVYRLDNNTKKAIYTNSYSSFLTPWDSIYIDTAVNTLELQYNYSIELQSASNSTLTSRTGSSIFLTALQSNSNVILNWNETVPWINSSYTIYKQNSNGNFDSINQSFTKSIVDFNPKFNEKLCYYVQSEGSYNSILDNELLLNNSQISCITIIDTVAACCLSLLQPNLCNTNEMDTSISIDFKFSLTDSQCKLGDIQYIYLYGLTQNNDTILLTTIEELIQLTSTIQINPQSYSAFFIKLIDNQNQLCNKIQLVYPITCPQYELPNTFTPNSDNRNDFFKPRKNQYIKEIDLKVFNRWGSLVFETKDPQINWNGYDMQGNKLENAVYYYSCKIVPVSSFMNGETLKGFIEILGSTK